MKAGLSLGDFIRDVKRELVAAQDASEQPFYELEEVQLEVSFVLDATAKAGAKLVVLEVGGETKAQQTHKVTLTLTPLDKPSLDSDESEPGLPPSGPIGGSGRGTARRRKPAYR